MLQQLYMNITHLSPFLLLFYYKVILYQSFIKLIIYRLEFATPFLRKFST